jgi:hypothetical protein
MHGTIAMHQARDTGRTAGSEIGAVDLAGFARSLGAEGFTVADPADLEGALREAVAHEGVSLVDVVTDPDLISPTARLSELAPRGTSSPSPGRARRGGRRWTNRSTNTNKPRLRFRTSLVENSDRVSVDLDVCRPDGGVQTRGDGSGRTWG